MTKLSKNDCIQLANKPIYKKLGINTELMENVNSFRDDAMVQRISWHTHCRALTKLRKAQKRLARKIERIEKHTYAPELTRIIFKGGAIVNYSSEYASLFRIQDNFTSIFKIPNRLVDRLQSIADTIK